MAVVHKLLPVVENTSNYPPFRFEGNCSCGFATKQATKKAVEDQLANHLQYHGVTGVTTLADEETKKAQNTKNKQAEWKPSGAK